MANNSLQQHTTLPHENIFEYNLRLHNRLWDDLSSLANKTRSNRHTLQILHHNAKSLFKNHFYYESLNLANIIDIFSVPETRLKPELPDQFLNLSGFNIVRCDRKSTTKSRGGGAALYINSDFKFTELNQPQKKLRQLCNSVWVRIKTTGSECLIVASIYLQPDSDKDNFIRLLSDILHQQLFIGKRVILLGDFNINYNSSSKEKQHIQQSLTTAGLKQEVVEVAHHSPVNLATKAF